MPERTAVCILADKEEIGSEGVSGMQSQAFDTFMSDLCETQGVALRRCFEKSFCLSADVCNAFDPNYPEVSEKRNEAKVNYGMGICKFTGCLIHVSLVAVAVCDDKPASACVNSHATQPDAPCH